MTKPSTPSTSSADTQDHRHGAAATGESPVPGPRQANQPADLAPEGPTTAWEYPRGDRGAAATEHEQQVRDSLAGPSRDDTARRL